MCTLRWTHLILTLQLFVRPSDRVCTSLKRCRTRKTVGVTLNTYSYILGNDKDHMPIKIRAVSFLFNQIIQIFVTKFPRSKFGEAKKKKRTNDRLFII